VTTATAFENMWSRERFVSLVGYVLTVLDAHSCVVCYGVILKCCRGMEAPRLREAMILSYLSLMLHPPKCVLADVVPYT
jgi:hypothetical protein